jgi:hypothetical protein
MNTARSTNSSRTPNSVTTSSLRRNAVLHTLGKFCLSPYVVVGVGLGTALSYCLFEQFYFYQAVVMVILCAPLAVSFLLYAPRRTLLGLLVLSIPFNPCFHVYHNERAVISMDLDFWASDLILICIYGYLLVDGVLNSGQRKPSNASTWTISLPLLLWITAGALSVLPAVEKSWTVIELVRMIRVLAIFVAVYHVVQGTEDIRFVVYFLLVAFTVQTGLIFVEYGLGHQVFRLPGAMRDADLAGEILRPGGTMGHSANFAKLAALCLPMCLVTAACARKKALQVFALTLLGSGLIALLMTVSRVGVATSMFGLAWILFLLLKTRKLSTAATTVVLVFLIIGIGFGWFMAGDSLMSIIADDQGSAALRPRMYENAWNTIKAHPLGVGLNNYTVVAPRYDRSPEGVMFQPVHNIYLLQAAEISVIGLSFFLWFLFRTVLHAFSYASKERSVFDSAIAAAIGVGVSCSWLQGLVGWGHRASIVHTSYLAILAGAFAALKYRSQKHNDDSGQVP